MEVVISLIPVIVIGGSLLLWVLMLAHAITRDISNRLLWVILLILGNVFAGIIYYFVVYRPNRKHAAGISRVVLVVFGIVAIISVPALLITGLPGSDRLQQVPLDRVIQDVNEGKIKRIEVHGNELIITRQGETGPTERSKQNPDLSLYEQGLDLNKVEIVVKPE